MVKYLKRFAESLVNNNVDPVLGMARVCPTGECYTVIAAGCNTKWKLPRLYITWAIAITCYVIYVRYMKPEGFCTHMVGNPAAKTTLYWRTFPEIAINYDAGSYYLYSRLCVSMRPVVKEHF